MWPLLIGIFSFSKENVRLLLFIASLLIIGYLVWSYIHVRDQVVEWRNIAQQYEIANEHNLKELKTLQRNQAAIEAALNKQLKNQEKKIKFLTETLEEIKNASPDADGPVAPVLNSTLDSLRSHQNSPSN